MSTPRPTFLRRAIAVATIAAVAAACSSGTDITSVSRRPVSDTASESSVPDDGVPCPSAREAPPASDPTSDAGGSAAGRALSGDEVLACVGSSVAFVETDLASGSGVLVDGGYVVTSGHVVDPFAMATVTFEGGETHADVPVVGLDPLTDIAVLGPIVTDRPSVALHDSTGITKGDDVFLIGYPGETDGEPELTISRGILSRHRVAEPFGTEFAVTDATIGEGQSGGALVDSRGEAIGISGIYYDEFAYALSGAHVQRSIESILAGTVAAYHPLSARGAATTSTLHVDDPAIDSGWLAISAAPAARTVTLTVTASGDPAAAAPARPSLAVNDLFSGEGVFDNEVALQMAADASGMTVDEIVDEYADTVATGAGGRETSPGVFEIDFPAGTTLSILYGADVASVVTIESDVAFTTLFDDSLDVGTAIALGSEVDGVLPVLGTGARYEIDLAEGQRIHLHAASVVGDVALSVQGPDQSAADADYFDDSGTGLFGTDVDEDFRSPQAGTYTIYVTEVSGVTTSYRLAITAA